MACIQLFHSRDCPGNILHANALRALENLDRDIPVEQVEAGPEHDGNPLPALAVNGRIVVSGVEPTVRELELLLADHVDEDGKSSCGSCGPCGMECGGCHGCENGKTPASLAGKIIGFIILLIILFTAVKILSLIPRSYKRRPGLLPCGPCSGPGACIHCDGKPPPAWKCAPCGESGRSGLRLLSSPRARSR